MEQKFRKWGFSKKEEKIAKLICKGLTTEQIAGRLGKPKSTVERWLKDLYEKIGVNSKVEMFARLLDL